jgi:hypothetical protein
VGGERDSAVIIDSGREGEGDCGTYFFEERGGKERELSFPD